MELRIEDGSETRVIEHAGDRTLALGRSAECDIVLTTGKGSRHHADIVSENGCFFLVDAGSKNGTRLNGVKIDRAQLNMGDVIAIGDARITFGEAAKAPEPPPPSGGAAPAPEAPPLPRARPTLPDPRLVF